MGGPFSRSAVPRAFFGTFFRAERKYCPPRDGSPTVRAGVGASVPPARDSLTAKLPCVAISRGLFARPLHSFGSPTETPKHPVPRRSRRVMLHPWASGMRLRAHKRAFRSPFGNLRAPKVARNPPESSHQAPARPLRPPHAGASPRHSCRVPTQAEFCSTPPPSGTLPQKFFLAIMPNFPTRAARFSLSPSSYG